MLVMSCSPCTKHEGDPNARNAAGFTPLMIAAGKGDYDECDRLLSAGADVHMIDSIMGASALHKAAQSGDVRVAKLLLENGAFIDLQAAANGHTALIDASWHRNADLVEFFLEQGADWGISGLDGSTARSWAEKAGDKHIVEIIDRYEAKRAEYIKNDRIFTAVLRNDVETVKKVIADGFDVNARATYRINPGTPKGITPLLLASRVGRVEIAKVLLDAGADPNIRDLLMQSSVVHKAAYTGRAGAIPWVLKAGADLDNQAPYNGYTALHDAAWHGNVEAAKELLKAGARQDLRGHDGNLPIDLARKYGYDEIIELLTKDAEK